MSNISPQDDANLAYSACTRHAQQGRRFRVRVPSFPVHYSIGMLLALGVTSLPLMAPLSAHAQASSSSDAAGHVSDASGAAVPGATIHLINNGTKQERTVITSDSGDWSIPNLPPANYSVRVEKEGFKTSVIPSLDIEIGKAANGSVTLAVGGTSETVEVTTLPPQLQTQEATVGQVIDQKQISDLPLNGRNVLQLATLAPGVSPPQQGQTGNPNRTGNRNLYVTVDGGRGSSTNYVLDGTYIRSVRFNNMSIQPNVDTLQEFNLLRNSFGVEYGQGQAVVSMVTKSGTNTIHGTAYEFARNSIFDARNYFATSLTNPTKPNFTRHQYGGTVGFPIVKDKLFVFGGFEGLRTNRATPLYGIYPTATQLGASVASNKLATYFTPTIPVPQTANGAATILGQYNYATTPNTTDNYDEYTIKADQVLSQRNTLFERYVDFNSTEFIPSVQGGINNVLIGRNGVIGDTFLFTPNIVNEARAAYNQYYNYELGVPLNPGVNAAQLEGLSFISGLSNPSQYGRAAITINGYSTISDNVTNQGGNENILSFGDTLSIVHGKHTFKTGFQFQNRRVIMIADNNSTGSFTFSDCTAPTYASGYTPAYFGDPNNITSVGTCAIEQKYKSTTTGGLYSRFENYQRGYCTSSCNGNYGTTRGHYRDNTYGAFLSDVWQLGHGLTANLGLRWEYNSPFVEQNGLEGTLDPTSGKIRYSKVPTGIPAAFVPYVDTSNLYRPGIINPFRKGFGPRVGLAYEVVPGTVVRGGFGIYFDNLNTNELQFTRYAAPLYYQQSTSNIFVQNAFPDPGLGTYGLPAPFSIRPNNSTPYTTEYNVSLQQDLGHGVLVEIAYTGSQSHKLWKRYDQNMDLLFPSSNPYVSNSTNAGVRPFPAFNHGILTSATYASANFNGGSIKVEKRAKNGLFFLGSYQWSKNLDNNSGEVEANDTSYSTSFQFDHSYARFDNRNRGVISGGYELPFGKGYDHLQGGVGNAVLGGWSLQPAIQLRSGYPFSPSRNGATFGTYTPGRVNLAPSRTLQSAFRSNPSPFNWFDPTAFADPGGALQGNVTRNTLRGPGTAQVDLSALKGVQITERLRIQFRAEAYNIINRGIFSQPASNISTTSTVGKVSSTSADNRSIQLAIKAIF